MPSSAVSTIWRYLLSLSLRASSAFLCSVISFKIQTKALGLLKSLKITEAEISTGKILPSLFNILYSMSFITPFESNFLTSLFILSRSSGYMALRPLKPINSSFELKTEISSAA